MSVKVSQIQKRNHGLLLQAEKRNLQLFREIIIQKEGRLSKENCWQIRKKQTKRDKLLELACDLLRPMSDDVEILARSWAMDFRKLKPDQQIYVKKAIDILFESQLGNPHKHTFTINEPPSRPMSSATPYSNQPSPYSSHYSSYSGHPSLNYQNYSLLMPREQPNHSTGGGLYSSLQDLLLEDQ